MLVDSIVFIKTYQVQIMQKTPFSIFSLLKIAERFVIHLRAELNKQFFAISNQFKPF